MADASSPNPEQAGPDQEGSAGETGAGESAAEAQVTTEPNAAPESNSDAGAQSSTAEIEQRLDDAAESLEKATGAGTSTEAEAKPFALGRTDAEF